SAACTELTFPYIGSGGCVSKSITTMGAHIITPNIFNLIVLYSNLNHDQLIEPEQILKCIGNNLFLNSSSSSTYINVQKFKQIIKIYSSRPLNDSLLTTDKPSASKNHPLSDFAQMAIDPAKNRKSASGAV